MAREDWGAICQISTPPKEQPIQVDSPMQVAKEQPEGATDILTSINTSDKESSVGGGVLTLQQTTLLPYDEGMEECLSVSVSVGSGQETTDSAITKLNNANENGYMKNVEATRALGEQRNVGRNEDECGSIQNVDEECVYKRGYCLLHKLKGEKRTIKSKRWGAVKNGYGWIHSSRDRYFCKSKKPSDHHSQ